MSAALGAVALLVAGLLPPGAPHRDAVARVLGALGVLALLPGVSGSGPWPFLLLAAGATILATPLAFALAAAGALRVAASPEGAAPVAAMVAGLAVAVAADGVIAGERGRTRSGATPSALVAGASTLVVLAAVDRGRVFAWTFGLGEGSAREGLPGAGLVLGVALLASLAGVLFLTAARLAPAPSAGPAGRRALGLSAVLCIVGALGTAARVVLWEHTTSAEAALSLAAVLAGGGALAVVLQERAPAPGRELARATRAERATALATVLALAALGAAGVESWWRAGSYLTSGSLAAASAALVGLAALEPTRFVGTRRLALLAALVVVAVG